MAAIDDIVNVTITLESSGVSGFGFGTPMVAASLSSAVATLWGPDVVRSYTAASQMLAASEGFTTADAAYKIVSSLFSQTPRPASVKVGRRTLPQTQVIKITPTNTTVGFVYAGQVQNKGWIYAVQSGDDIDKICDGIVSAINTAAPAGITAAPSGSTATYLTCTATAGLAAEYEFWSSGFTVEDTTTDPGIATDLAAIKAVDPDWYGLLIDSFGAAEIEAAAAWCDAAGLVFFHAQSGDSAVITAAYSSGSPADVASYLKAHGVARTACWWQKDLTFNLAPAILGEEITRIPGSSVFYYKNLSGPVPSDQLTATQVARLVAKNCNYYQTIGSLGRTMNGKVAGSSYVFVDNVVFIDWWKNTCQTNIVGYLVSRPKVPFTDAGIAGVVGQVELTNQQGIENGGIASSPAPTVTAPRAVDVSAANKENRNLPDVNCEWYLAGAIKTVGPITVTVKV